MYFVLCFVLHGLVSRSVYYIWFAACYIYACLYLIGGFCLKHSKVERMRKVKKNKTKKSYSDWDQMQ